jgi:hypothetical protein
LRGVEEVQITLDGLPQRMLGVAAASPVLPTPVVVPVGVAYAAQVDRVQRIGSAEHVAEYVRVLPYRTEKLTGIA